MNRKYLLPLLLLVQIIGLKLLAFFPNFVEKNYSNLLYPIISKFSRTCLGWIPFSVGDVLYGILIIWAICWFYKSRKENWKNKVLSVLGFVSVAYFVFHLLWAFNYYRVPLFEKMNIKREYSDQQLLCFTKKIIVKTNEIQFQITNDTAKKVTTVCTQNQIFDKSIVAYQKLSKEYSFFTYGVPSQKKSLFSYPLTYMGFGGYLNPFTNEAQVNNMIPMYNFPSTACHEMAHQMGYASESECNFISFLSAIKTEDLYFKYSGYSFALRYCLFNWEVRNPQIFKKLLKTINPGVLKNYQESQHFWESHQTFIDTGFKIFYDNFLKLNQQKDGLESYSKFVDLMVNYYSSNNEL
ncbi:DUF3810 domain-containing protein [Flavobacterium psychrophilum]|uniref:DUF3810 domain-containing protein n=1 Tax=Flavobacterium psychrophilum TaxID=96345 RepID=UPI001C8F5A20|nr:DUF3810 domain-containing protein [Flavobacterium psychrophilum]EKT4499586.1 DUF3810 domain-containing protein [Flavobacterium psychrophilum]ELM3650788.1 DUF3810 domain-containing protein [Flavobacterium psychrophilum]ELM3672067.1 DUF3810 domain-containing protein [Flavobacterium psychrophilum]ELM3725946.1 DUF3810 domain-containing protein [Flavobacterium psychrophilum]ELY1991961.1 DUF3810 domain-containing protein [Flavobacterium psychrophilum]